MKNNYFIFAGIVLLATALLHTIGGQLTLINPLFDSDITLQVKSELLGAWHMVTILLWVMGIVALRNGLRPNIEQYSLMKLLTLLNLLFGCVFILVIIFQHQHTPQYILFFPIAILLYLGLKKHQIS